MLGNQETHTDIFTCSSFMPVLNPCLGSRRHRPDEVNYTAVRAWLRGLELPLPRRRNFSSLPPQFFDACGGKQSTMTLRHNVAVFVPCTPSTKNLVTLCQVKGCPHLAGRFQPKPIGRAFLSGNANGRGPGGNVYEIKHIPGYRFYRPQVPGTPRNHYSCYVRRHQFSGAI